MKVKGIEKLSIIEIESMLNSNVINWGLRKNILLLLRQKKTMMTITELLPIIATMAAVNVCVSTINEIVNTTIKGGDSI